MGTNLTKLRREVNQRIINALTYYINNEHTWSRTRVCSNPDTFSNGLTEKMLVDHTEAHHNYPNTGRIVCNKCELFCQYDMDQASFII